MISKQLTSMVLPQGFRYIPNFVNELQKDQLLKIIKKYPWCSRLRRQQQYYGIKYFQTKYQDKILQNKQSMDHFPLSQFSFVRERIKKQLNIKTFIEKEQSPNQVLVNKYLKRDGLSFHVEDVHAFGQCIVGLSLGDYDYLRLVPADQVGKNKVGQIKIKLQDRSIYILEGQARYNWRHGIGKLFEGQPFKTQEFTRISLTFRDVIQTRRKL